MKYQNLFSSKDKSKKKILKVLSAAILLGSLRVNKGKRNHYICKCIITHVD